jgi:hypothetical protein
VDEISRTRSWPVFTSLLTLGLIRICTPLILDFVPVDHQSLLKLLIASAGFIHQTKLRQPSAAGAMQTLLPRRQAA